MKTKVIRDRLIKEGIKPDKFDRFKLRNPHAYEKLEFQFRLNDLVGITKFKKAIGR